MSFVRNILQANREIGKIYHSSTFCHLGVETQYFDRMIRVKGLGRWIYCKYCNKYVLPWLGGTNQIICPDCGYGLTPDFFSFKSLQKWLAGKELEEINDGDTLEAKSWIPPKEVIL